jgi:hypothetical protein
MESPLHATRADFDAVAIQAYGYGYPQVMITFCMSQVWRSTLFSIGASFLHHREGRATTILIICTQQLSWTCPQDLLSWNSKDEEGPILAIHGYMEQCDYKNLDGLKGIPPGLNIKKYISVIKSPKNTHVDHWSYPCTQYFQASKPKDEKEPSLKWTLFADLSN